MLSLSLFFFLTPVSTINSPLWCGRQICYKGITTTLDRNDNKKIIIRWSEGKKKQYPNVATQTSSHQQAGIWTIMSPSEEGKCPTSGGDGGCTPTRSRAKETLQHSSWRLAWREPEPPSWPQILSILIMSSDSKYSINKEFKSEKKNVACR